MNVNVLVHVLVVALLCCPARADNPQDAVRARLSEGEQR
jgi:hypothetical protein